MESIQNLKFKEVHFFCFQWVEENEKKKKKIEIFEKS